MHDQTSAPPPTTTPRGRVLRAEPEVAATPLGALDLDTVPARDHFRRNHATYPALDPATWRLAIDGAVGQPLVLDLATLRGLEQVELVVTLECAGHRRTEFAPLPPGIAWETGAVAHSRWRGPRLLDVLALARPTAAALEVVFHGADVSPVDDCEGEHAYHRAVPLDEPALADSLIALELDGAPLPVEHGAPARTLVAGWYAMASVKWLVGIELVDRPYRGAWQAHDYRLWRDDLPPEGVALGRVPVTSMLTSVAEGDRLAAGARLLRGIAWGGDGGIATVEVRVDGAPLAVELAPQTDRFGPRHFSARWNAAPGAHLISCCATDAAGTCQPERVAWNRRGYGNNAVHRVAVQVG